MNPRNQKAPILVVAGAPGAGKTTIAALLAEAWNPPPAILDKDTVYGGFVGAMLHTAGRPDGEREGAWYDQNIKGFEYEGLAATAHQIRSHGCPVILEAPFTNQIRDPDTWKLFVETLGGEPVHLVWVRSDAATLRHRLISRGLTRDTGKLEHFDEFVTRMQPDVPPPVPHHEIDNRGDGSSAASAVAALVELA